MRKRFVVAPVLLTIGLLTACNTGEVVSEHEYEEFKDTIYAEDFTGFAYLLVSHITHEGGHIEEIEKVFNETNNQLHYSNTQNYDQETFEQLDEDTRNQEFPLPSDSIVYINNGEEVERFDIENDVIKTAEYQQALQSFIENRQ